MAKYPERTADVGRLVDLGQWTLTTTPQPISTYSRPVVSISIQNTEDQGNDIMVGDVTRQSWLITGGNDHTFRAADASQVYVHSDTGTVVAAIHILEP